MTRERKNKSYKFTIAFNREKIHAKIELVRIRKKKFSKKKMKPEKRKEQMVC